MAVASTEEEAPASEAAPEATPENNEESKEEEEKNEEETSKAPSKLSVRSGMDTVAEAAEVGSAAEDEPAGSRLSVR